MKKLLLLLMALTLFAPPRAHADHLEIYNASWDNATLLGEKKNTQKPGSNGYYFDKTGGWGIDIQSVANWATGFHTTTGSYELQGFQMGESVKEQSNTIISDKVQLYIPSGVLNQATMTMMKKSSTCYLSVKGEREMIIRALYGTIQNVYFTHHRLGTDIPTLKNWTSEQGTFDDNSFTAYGDGAKEIHIKMPDGVNQWAFTKISVDWRAGTPVKPGKQTQFKFQSDEYDEATQTLTVRGSNTNMTIFPEEGAEMVLMTTSTNAVPTTITGNNSLATSSSTYGTESTINSKWVRVKCYANIPFKVTLPSGPKIGTTYNLRIIGWNPKGFSEVNTVKLKYESVDGIPEVDTDNLPEGMTYVHGEDNNGTIYFNKYDSANLPKVPIKHKNGGSTLYYNYSTVAPTTTAKTGTVSASTTGASIGVPIKHYDDPVKNQRLTMSIKWYDGYGLQQRPLNIVCIYTGGDDSEDQKKVLAAPSVKVDDNAIKAELAGGVTAFVDENGVKVSLESQMGTENAKFQYQFCDATNGIWAQTPEATKWQAWPDGGYTVNATGRLFVRETDGESEARETYRDFSKISTKVTDLALTDVNDGDVITLYDFDQYNVVGRYETVKPNDINVSAGTWFVYLTDSEGRAIKVIVNGENETVKSYTDGKSINNITGVVRGIESGLPELWITTSAMDYSAFLPNPDDATYFTSTIKEVTEIERADFNKKVVLRNVTFNAADNILMTSTGKVVKPYARLKTTPDFATIMRLNEGTTYSVEGFVGYANGDMVLLPTSAIATPKLLAPNPITATDEDKANGYITVNVVSDVVTLTPDITGVRSGTALIYSKNGGASTTLSEIVDGNAKIEITADDYVDDENLGKVCTLQVAYNRGNIDGERVIIKFVKKEAEPVASIAEFKAKYPDEADAKDGIIYRYEGKALVREITPKYLYLRDVKDDGTEFGKDELSAHSILLYNKNGWETLVAMNTEGKEAPRKLEKGDIITNFAFKASRTGLQNLRGDNTGYARTLRRIHIEGDPIEYEPQVKDILEEENNSALTPFTEADRMVRYKINNVTVSKGLDGDKEVFTLNMAGNPVLNIGEVFKISKGFSTAYLASARYNIDGVVLRNGDKGNYAVALIDFSIVGEKALAEPELTIKGEGVEGGKFLTTATVEMKYTGEVEDVDIYYTLDNSNPRLNKDGRKKYTGPFEISATTIVKAYAAKAGKIPSEVAEATFTRTANERRYIVNFLDQAEAGVPYHFSGIARVVAKGGEYIFVRGTQGHYLPINIEDAALLESIKKDSYVSDFVMEPHILGGKVRGAHVTADYASLFATPSDTKPAGLEKDIEMVPDEVTTITTANARRYVKIMGVKLTGTGFEADGDEATQDTEWKLTTNKGEGEDIPVNHDKLEATFNWNGATPAAYYNITGFAMLDDSGEGIELWPVEVEKVRSSEPVVAVIKDNVTIPAQTVEGITTVEFYPYTTVTLNCPISNPKSATIYYNVSPTPIVPGPDTEWNVYAQRFAITSTSYITMYATAPGYEQSLYTHVEATLGKPAGTVAFSVTANPGSTAVKMTAAEGADIYYTTDANIAEENWTKAANGASVSFTEQTTLWAYAMEGNKKGAVSSMLVMVMPEQTTTPENPGQPDPTKVSGKVKVELDTESDLTKVTITLAPAEAIADGTYQIWYAFNPTAECVPGNNGNMTLYTAPIERKEGGRLVAILIENGKVAGEPADQYITLIPTDIDGIDSDRREDEIRVEAGSIIAPEGSAVFDITGRRVNATGLRAGIYIVRTAGGKAVKVKVD